MRQSGEEVEGLTVEPLESLSAQDERQIRTLQYSAVDASKNKKDILLKREMDDVFEHFQEPQTDDRLIVAREKGRIVGFLAFAQIHGEAHCKDILLGELHGQQHVIAKLLYAAEEAAREAQCGSVIIDAPNPTEEFAFVCRLSRFSNVEEDQEHGQQFVKNLSSRH